MRIERTRTYIRFNFWWGIIQFNTRDTSEKAECKIINLTQYLSPEHLYDTKCYLEALWESRNRL